MERIMDPAAVARLEAIGGRNLVRSLAGLVREELPPRLARLEEARARRDFDEADRLRDEIAAAGWDVRDVAGGYELVPRR